MENKDNKSVSYPLVTIAVIAYRAEQYVEETLDSIKAQTYPNIELIISDDKSPDNTVDVCRKWIEKNGDRFAYVRLLEAETNGGVVANCNRALNATNGEWIKPIGSDDILFPDAIEKLYAYVNSHNNVKALFGRQVYFYGDFSEGIFKENECGLRITAFRKIITARDQFKILTKSFFGCAAAFMMQTQLLKEIGGFDERWPIEDHPLYVNITKSNNKIFYLHDFVVYRRIHNDSIMQERADNDVMLSKIEIKNALGGLGFLYENSNWIWRKFYILSQKLNYSIIKSGNSKKSLKCQFWKFMARWFDPYNYYSEYLTIKEKTLRLLSRIDSSINNEE